MVWIASTIRHVAYRSLGKAEDHHQAKVAILGFGPYGIEWRVPQNQT